MADAGLPMRLDSTTGRSLNGATWPISRWPTSNGSSLSAAAPAIPNSWTAKLFARGMDKAAQKLGEEAVETVIAAVKGKTPRPGFGKCRSSLSLAGRALALAGSPAVAK